MKTLDVVTLLEWIDEEWVPLEKIASVAGLFEGADHAEVRAGVLATIEGPLRAGLVRVGSVYYSNKRDFSELDLPPDGVIAIIVAALPTLAETYSDLDMWFDMTPAGEAFLREHREGKADDGRKRAGRREF